MSTTMTRRALYEVVWVEPVSVLAARLGISGPGLKKACVRAAIPVPPGGHWARPRAGKKGQQAALPPRPPGLAEELRLGRTDVAPLAEMDLDAAPPPSFRHCAGSGRALSPHTSGEVPRWKRE